MKVIIADSLASSLNKLDALSQALVKQNVFDFQVNPEQPSFQAHRIESARDKGFWSLRVNRDLRIVVHRSGETHVLCYVAHHDEAYRWAERRRLEVHPETGAAQMVVLDERVEEVVRRVVREVPVDPPVFAKYESDYLLALGVPLEYLDAARQVAQPQLFELLDLLPAEAAERLFDLAAGRIVPRPGRAEGTAFEHPDAQRRFKIVATSEDLRLALEAGWEKWTVFLHPSQRAAVEKRYKGPAKVSGGAGTGKTVVALHRAVRLARLGRGRVLLTTFSSTLASRLSQHLDHLLAADDEARQRLTVMHLHKLARDLWVKGNRRKLRIADDRKVLEQHLREAERSCGGSGFDLPFLRAEWEQVVLANDVRTWDQYKAVSRVGRGISLGAKQRKKLWTVFELARASLGAAGLLSWEQTCHEAAALLETLPQERFAHVVADEVQDFGYPELLLLRRLVLDGEDDIFLCGDPGQRIYKMRSSWGAAGINIRGRSTRLRVNYRTTEQIREFASAILDERVEDGDGEAVERETVSLLSGPEPEVKGFATAADEVEAVTAWIRALLAQGYAARELAVFGRIESILVERAQTAVEGAGLQWARLRDDQTLGEDHAAVGTMHRAKGLEFKVVVIMGCDRGLLPLGAALRDLADPVDRAAIHEQEKSLLYVAATRARERLLLTYAGEPSELLRV
ncbi:MAG: 3'-5' exonuclease [Myxococcota bacterium]|nr:3'-5' exonuclease [Myxococcota bacterium]